MQNGTDWNARLELIAICTMKIALTNLPVKHVMHRTSRSTMLKRQRYLKMFSWVMGFHCLSFLGYFSDLISYFVPTSRETAHHAR